jgi:hypothetical protein
LNEVETFDYDYMRDGQKRPDRLPQLIANTSGGAGHFVNRESRSVHRKETINAARLA